MFLMYILILPYSYLISAQSMILSSIFTELCNNSNSPRNLKPSSLSQTFTPHSFCHSSPTPYSHDDFYSSQFIIYEYHFHYGFACLSASLNIMAYNFNKTFTVTLDVLSS